MRILLGQQSPVFFPLQPKTSTRSWVFFVDWLFFFFHEKETSLGLFVEVLWQIVQYLKTLSLQIIKLKREFYSAQYNGWQQRAPFSPVIRDKTLHHHLKTHQQMAFKATRKPLDLLPWEQVHSLQIVFHAYYCATGGKQNNHESIKNNTKTKIPEWQVFYHRSAMPTSHLTIFPPPAQSSLFYWPV